ncbi:MAG TPA: PLP-dependent aminotransferase family protein [Flavihumibacter sp.]
MPVLSKNAEEKSVLYLRIARNIEQQIRDGVWKVGDKLPSIRMICREQGVSMSTAIQAYLELERKALIESRPQSGFYVSQPPFKRLAVPAISRPRKTASQQQVNELIDRVYATLGNKKVTQFSLGAPATDLLPVAKLNKALVQAMREMPDSGTAYEEVQGNIKLRQQIARWSFAWGSHLNADDLVTTAGTMNALSFSLMAVTRPGDTIAVESPVYFGILQVARSLGLRVMEIPTHPVTGIELDALKKLLPQINCCLLIPNFNNPLGSLMPDEHKRELVAMLEAAEIPLIEDDLYGDVYFGDHRPVSCKTFDQSGNVLWCSSVSKTLAPGYRVGWVAPGRFKEKVMHLKTLHAISSTSITQEVVARFLESGRYEHHLRKLRRTLYTNCLHYTRAIADYFPDSVKVSQPKGGFVLWVEMPKQIDSAELYEMMIRQQISIAPGRMFSLQNQFDNCMRLSYGLLWDESLDRKLKTLGRAVASLL